MERTERKQLQREKGEEREVCNPGDTIRANGASQKWTPPEKTTQVGVHFWEMPFALMLSPGWLNKTKINDESTINKKAVETGEGVDRAKQLQREEREVC